ncbi:c-type cytochrome [Candidatus Riflebacteria bacterium]
MNRILITFSLGILVLFLYVMFKCDERTEYLTHQKAYQVALQKAGVKTIFSQKIRQLVLPKYNNRIDRCVSCHVGLEDPRMKDAEHPLKTHPGTYLDDHNVNEVGCTNCHDGQGRAMTKRDAHATNFLHWERKLLLGKAIQSTCTRCHSPDSKVMLPDFVKGRDLFRSKGCLGCHKLNGRGGKIGVDLSAVGDASSHIKTPVDRKHVHDLFHNNVNLAYIYESILYPRANASDSKMLDYKFSSKEAMALTVFLKSLVSLKPFPKKARDIFVHKEFSGEKLFNMYCIACHSEKKTSALFPAYNKYIPALMNNTSVSINEHDFLFKRISNSGKTLMPIWGKSGGLTASGLQSLVEYILAEKKDLPAVTKLLRMSGRDKFDEIPKSKNKVVAAKAYANGKHTFLRCTPCHGTYEQEGIAPVLFNPYFLNAASNRILQATIALGRPGTPMVPLGLKNQQINNVIFYLREKSANPKNEFEELIKATVTPVGTSSGTEKKDTRSDVKKLTPGAKTGVTDFLNTILKKKKPKPDDKKGTRPDEKKGTSDFLNSILEKKKTKSELKKPEVKRSTSTGEKEVADFLKLILENK